MGSVLTVNRALSLCRGQAQHAPACSRRSHPSPPVSPRTGTAAEEPRHGIPTSSTPMAQGLGLCPAQQGRECQLVGFPVGDLCSVPPRPSQSPRPLPPSVPEPGTAPGNPSCPQRGPNWDEKLCSQHKFNQLHSRFSC